VVIIGAAEHKNVAASLILRPCPTANYSCVITSKTCLQMRIIFFKVFLPFVI